MEKDTKSKKFKEAVKSALKEAIELINEIENAPICQEEAICIRFHRLKDGWVLDRLLGLEWGPVSAKRMNFANAGKYCAELVGRLPTSKELMTLIDHGRHDPAIVETFVKETPTNDWYWTGTRCVWPGSTSAWCVSFNSGIVDYRNEFFGYYVRPVRVSQCRPLTF